MPPVELLHILLQSHSIMAAMCIWILSWSLSPGASLCSHDCGLQVYNQARSIKVSKFPQLWPPSKSSKSLNHNITVHLYIHVITVSKCIFDIALLQPPTSNNHGLPSVLHNSHTQFLQLHMIIASKFISIVTQSHASTAWLSLLNHKL